MGSRDRRSELGPGCGTDDSVGREGRERNEEADSAGGKGGPTRVDHPRVTTIQNQNSWASLDSWLSACCNGAYSPATVAVNETPKSPKSSQPSCPPRAVTYLRRVSALTSHPFKDVSPSQDGKLTSSNSSEDKGGERDSQGL